MCLVPGDLAVDVSDIELRLRIDCNRGAGSTIRINIPGNGCRRFVRLGVCGTLGIPVLAQQRLRVVGDPASVRT